MTAQNILDICNAVRNGEDQIVLPKYGLCHLYYERGTLEVLDDGGRTIYDDFNFKP